MTVLTKQHETRPGRTTVSSIESSNVEPNDVLDLHVVMLNNYVRPHHAAAYRELAKRVRKLTILLSVSMEPNRTWTPEWQGLDVRVQNNWMFTTRWRHTAGFQEPNYIHIPVDTNRQLKQLKPDIVFSYEMGMRTLFSCWYRLWHRNIPLVMVGNMSEHVEGERGIARRLLRRLICRGVDYFTYNGPSCQRYLESLTRPANRLFPLSYCIDDRSVYAGPLVTPKGLARRLLYCGSLSERKGILQFARAISKWCTQNPRQPVVLSIAGLGPLKDEIARCTGGNLTIEFLGECDASQLRDAYRDADINVFPSLADEWGLVPIEAMGSGQPVLGSIFAQSVEAVCREGENGWLFDPTNEQDICAAIDRAMTCSDSQLVAMSKAARESVAHITPGRTANEILDLIHVACPNVATTM